MERVFSSGAERITALLPFARFHRSVPELKAHTRLTVHSLATAQKASLNQTGGTPIVRSLGSDAKQASESLLSQEPFFAGTVKRGRGEFLRIGELFMTSYQKKLLDPRWQRISAIVKERAEWRCQRCGAENKSLHAHHRVYEKGRDPWDYPLSYFECLCFECHQKIEEALFWVRFRTCDMVLDEFPRLFRLIVRSKFKRLELTKIEAQELHEEMEREFAEMRKKIAQELTPNQDPNGSAITVRRAS